MTRNAKSSTPAYLSQLRGSRTPYRRLSDLRAELPISALQGLSRWMPNLALTEPALVHGWMPQNIKGVRDTRIVLKPVSLERETLWAAHVLKNQAGTLNKFLKLRSQIDCFLLNGSYDDCDSVLEGVEQSVSHSLWSLELHLATASFWKGLEGQKAYANNVLSNANNFVEFFVSYISQRNEELSNPFRFCSSFQALVEGWPISPAFRAYLIYRVADEWQNSPGNIGAILRMEAISPLIDYYETFVRLASRAIASGIEVGSHFHQPIALLAKEIDDQRLKNLIDIFSSDGRHVRPRIPEVNITILDKFTRGSYEQALNEIGEMPTTNRDEMIVRIAAKCSAERDNTLPTDHTLFGRLVGLCRRLIVKDQGIDETFAELIRLACNFRFAKFTAGLQEFASRQLSSAPLPSQIEAAGKFAASPYLDVAAIPYLPEAVQVRLAGSAADLYPNSIGVLAELSRAITATRFVIPEGISRELRNEIEIETTYRYGDDLHVGELAVEIYGLANILSTRFASRLHSNSLIRTNQLGQAIDLIVDTCLDDVGSVRMLPLRDCIERMDKAARRELAGNLGMPILVDLFTRNIDDRQRELREFTYEDFLLANSLSRPSELGAIAHRFDLRRLTYYLRFVCVQEVMQVSPAFQSSQSLQDERLAVCSLLARLDKQNAKIYEREIDEITRKQLIQTGVRQVEQSKISIDLDPLRRWARRNLSDSFARLKALKHAGIASELKISKTPESAAPASNEFELPEVPIEQTANLLVSMIRSLLDECFHNPKHGLDCYLSMRVRHGALSGQLRAALEDEKIITQRKGGSDEYARNDYWLTRLALPGDVALELDARLRCFAKDYDGLIGEFAAKKVQISSNENPGALFANQVAPSSIQVLAVELHAETAFDSFLDLCFNAFSQTVEHSLESVRTYIDNTLKPQLNALFVSLLADAEKITADIATPQFDTAIRTAQTRTQQALDGVKDWFRQVNPPPPRSFSVEELVHIGLEQVKKRSFGFDPILACEMSGLPEFANLARFSDIFVILFENVARHSGLVDQHRVNISASIDDPVLRLSFESKVSPDVHTEENKEKLVRIRRIVTDGSLHAGIKSEGGTGLIKLGNIIRGERSVQEIDFGFTETDTFYVHMEIPFREVELDFPEGANRV